MQNYQPGLNLNWTNEFICLLSRPKRLRRSLLDACLSVFKQSVVNLSYFFPLVIGWTVDQTYKCSTFSPIVFVLPLFFFTLSPWSYKLQHQSKVLMRKNRLIREAVSCRKNTYFLTWFHITCGGLLAWQLLLRFLNELLLTNREKKVRT